MAVNTEKVMENMVSEIVENNKQLLDIEQKKEEPSPDLQQRKTELVLEMLQKKYDSEINYLKQQIVSLEKELSLFKAKLDSKQDAKPEVKKPQSSWDNAEPLKPRTGDYKPSDKEVSIEKFFYFGGK